MKSKQFFKDLKKKILSKFHKKASVSKVNTINNNQCKNIMTKIVTNKKYRKTKQNTSFSMYSPCRKCNNF